MGISDVLLSAAMVAIPVAFLILTGRPRHQERVTRRWMRGLGEDDPAIYARASSVLMARERSVALGMSGGTFVGFVGSVPLWGHLSDWSSPVFSVSLAWAAGALVGATVQAVAEGRNATAPSGTRVALSTPPRVHWFVSRIGLLLLTIAAGFQVAVGYLRIQQVWAFDGGWSTGTVVATAALALLVATVIGSAVLLCWLVEQPFHAADEGGLRAEVALRRDQCQYVARFFFPVMIDVGLVVSGIDDANVPFPVRSGSSELFFQLSLLTLGFLTVGNLVALLPRESAVRHLRLSGPAPVRST